MAGYLFAPDDLDDRPIEQRLGQEALIAADYARIERRFAKAAQLSALTGDDSFYPLLSICEFSHRLGQLLKAVGKIGFVLAARGATRGLKLGFGATRLINGGHASPSPVPDTGSLGEDSPRAGAQSAPAAGHHNGGAS